MNIPELFDEDAPRRIRELAGRPKTPPEKYRVVIILGAIEDEADSEAADVAELTTLKLDLFNVPREHIMGLSGDPAVKAAVRTFEKMVYGIDPPAESATAEAPQPTDSSAEERQSQSEKQQ